MSVVIYFLLLLIGAYLMGSVPSAYLVARICHGVDIRQYGSGNVGVGNLWQTISKWFTLPAIIIDLGKGMIMVWVAHLVGLNIAMQVTVGLAAIVGHNWPVFLCFNGGRGVLTSLGVVTICPAINGLIPWEILAFCAIAAIGALFIRSVPLGVGAGIAVLPLVSWGLGRPVSVILGFLAIFLLMVLRRLSAPRPFNVTLTGKKQLLINRLLFDRDIRDKGAWIYRVPDQNNEV